MSECVVCERDLSDVVSGERTSMEYISCTKCGRVCCAEHEGIERNGTGLECPPCATKQIKKLKMTGGFLDFGLLEKMEPMARRALASLEAMQNALVHKNTEDVSKHIAAAENALSALKKDLHLVKSFEQTAAITKSDSEGVVGEGLPMGNISQHNNTVSDYDGTEGAVVLGISRMGRSSTIWRPQSE